MNIENSSEQMLEMDVSGRQLSIGSNNIEIGYDLSVAGKKYLHRGGVHIGFEISEFVCLKCGEILNS